MISDKMIKVVITIISYNSGKKIVDCLNSLRQADFSGIDYKLVMVDNASSDDSVSIIRNNFAEVEVIINENNLGFAGANNQGYEFALNWGADYLFLLNDDTIVDKDFLQSALLSAQGDERIGAVQSKLLLWPEKDLINSYGNQLTFYGLAYCGDYRQSNRDGQPKDLAYPSGASVLLKMSALRKSGLFDDDFFMYHEDVDLGWRLRLAGYRVILEPKSIVYHKYQFTKSNYKYFYAERNRLIVLLTNYQLKTLLLLFPILVLIEFFLLLVAYQGGWLKEKFLGYKWLLDNNLKLVERRRYVNSLRQTTDQEIVSLLSSQVDFSELPNNLLTRSGNYCLYRLWLFLRFLIVW